MNKVFKILIGAFITISIIGGLFAYYSLNTFSDNTLYSSEDVIAIEEENKKEYITREKAIDKALNIFKEYFNVDINRDTMSESIDLYETKSAGFEWGIMWTENKNKKDRKDYYCNILAKNGQILGVGIDEFNKINKDYNKEKPDVDIKVIDEIIDPFEKKLNLNLNAKDYNIKLGPDYSNNYIIIDYVNKENIKDVYRFKVDYTNKKLVEFFKFNMVY